MLSAQLAAVLESGGVLDRRQLCIQAGRAAWALYVDVYVLDAGGRAGTRKHLEHLHLNVASSGQGPGSCCMQQRPRQDQVHAAAMAPRLRIASRTAVWRNRRWATAWPAAVRCRRPPDSFCPAGGHLESLPCLPPWHGATLNTAQSGLGSAPFVPAAALLSGRAGAGSQTQHFSLHSLRLLLCCCCRLLCSRRNCVAPSA